MSIRFGINGCGRIEGTVLPSARQIVPAPEATSVQVIARYDDQWGCAHRGPQTAPVCGAQA